MDDLIARAERVCMDLGIPSTTTIDSQVIRDLIAELRKVTAERDAARTEARMSSFAGEGYVFMQARAEAAEAEVARLRAELAAARGRVKPLVFEHGIAPSVFGDYAILYLDGREDADICLALSLGTHGIISKKRWHEHEGLAVIAFAQADYTARILAALEPDPAIERMRDALRPFAAVRCKEEVGYLTDLDFERTRAALQEG